MQRQIARRLIMVGWGVEKGKVWRGNVGWKCGRGVGKRRESEGLERRWNGLAGTFGACPRLILVALVLWRFWCRSLIRGSSCSVLDALERWGRGGAGCRWWLVQEMQRQIARRLFMVGWGVEKGKVWRGNVGWKCGRGVGKRRESEGLERRWRLEVWGGCGAVSRARSALVPD